MTTNEQAAITLSAWLRSFSEALEAGDVAATLRCFNETSYWRDAVAFTWSIETCEGHAEIRALLQNTLLSTSPRNWKIEGAATDRNGMVEAFLSFETKLGRGQGYVRLVDGRCFTLLTALRELKGFEEPIGRRRPLGAVHRPVRNRRSWSEDRQEEIATLGVTEQPFVLIVGGGQAGLALGARLRQVKVPTLIVDRYARPGDQWRSRYKSLTLHDPVWYDHLPYMPFPENWPVFTPKDKMADWLESYAKLMELNIWNSTECVRATYDETAGQWNVLLRRDGAELTVRPAHLVFAIGSIGKPNIPQIAGHDTFTGKQYHSSRHPGGEGLEGRKVVVIGSNTSAHDICADLWEHGADVTMVQRSSTHVVQSSSMLELSMLGPYSEDAIEAGISTEKADLLGLSVPFRVLEEMQRAATKHLAQRDAEFYERLEAAGFLHDFGEDGTGGLMKALRRGGGYYIDVGASELITNGDIKLRCAGVECIKPAGVVLTTGELLPAQVIIYATGFGAMEQWAGEIVSGDVVSRVGKTSGYGSNTTHDPGPWEGEIRNMWKPTVQQGLWFHGGNLALSRNFSRYLALQLKARLERLPVKVFKVDRSVAARRAEATKSAESQPLVVPN